MNYKRALENLGLIENEDFTLTVESFEMLPKTETVEVSPAEFDEEGNLLFDAVTEEVDATPTRPSEEQLQTSWEEVQLKECDIALLVSAYLEGKERDPENDSINIVENKIHSWSFAHVARPSNAELLALKNVVEQKISQAEINAAALKYLADTDYLVIRSIDDPSKQVSEEVKQLRQQARDRIVRL